MRHAALAVLLPLGICLAAEDQLVIDAEVAGISGFRAHWNSSIPLAEDGKRVQVDAKVQDRGQTAPWSPERAAPISFDAVQRQMLVRFPGAAERIAAGLAAGKAIAKAELVLAFVDEEIWPPGRVDFPTPDGYRYRQNWDCDNYYRGVVRPQTREKTPALAYREERPTWHAVAWALRKPWHADAATGPTWNAAIAGSVYWKRFGASDTAEDRFPARFGPAETSSHHPEGRLDISALLSDPAYGASAGARLRLIADCGLVVAKEELYDFRYYAGAYEFTTTTGGRAVIVRRPGLVITWKAGTAATVDLPRPADVAALTAEHARSPLGAPTAVVPSPAEVARLNDRFLAKPGWMPDWQYERVRQLMGLQSGGRVEPFYYRLLPDYVARDAIGKLRQQAGKGHEPPQADLDYAVYLAWIDWNQGRQPRTYEGHLTAADAVTQWFSFREALPEAVQDTILRGWNAWLMPDRESAPTDAERKDYGDLSGRLIHPMADDPRVGLSGGKAAEWGQGDIYYLRTGDWRGNKSFFRSGFTSMMSTANFNSTAVTGALLGGQMIGCERAVADGSAGLMRFPFWLWTWNAGVGQEYIDHYYWSIAIAGNKLFADLCARDEDRAAGWSIMEKTVGDLAMAYHPGLRKLIGPASRTYYEHVLGVQDGIYHILHVLSPKGVLCDTATGVLPDLTPTAEMAAAQSGAKDAKAPAPLSAWGHDFPPDKVAQSSLCGPWASPWMSEWIDDKPLPWYALAEKKVVAEGDLVTTWFGQNYGLASIRATGQRIQLQGKWRRRPQAPESMRDLGTLDVLLGFNQTQVGNDSEGVITKQGDYRIAQHHGKLVVLARPNPEVIARRAGEYQFGQRKLPAQDITSVQCSAVLFDFEPQPTWSIRVDGVPLAGLPATARTGQVITIRDGVSYLAIRPLPTTDLGRDAEVTLEAGRPQTQAYHEGTRIQAALEIHANIYRRAAPLPADAMARLKDAWAGFAIEMGDEAEYGSFERFEEQVRKATLQASSDAAACTVTYASGGDTITAAWHRPAAPADAAAPAVPFAVTINGSDPYAAMKSARLWQDTPLGQIGLGRRLEKAGAVIERAPVRGNNPMMLQVFPRQKTTVCTNPVPGYAAYRFATPEGVRVAADGLCSMGQWAVVDGGRAIRVRYTAFHLAGGDLPEPAARATALFISGLAAKPEATVNGKTVALRAFSHQGASGWLLPLEGEPPADAAMEQRLQAMEAQIAAAEPERKP